MKVFIAGIGFFVFLVEAAAQSGTVNFANGAALVDAPVTMGVSDEKVSGPEWQAELLYLSGENFIAVGEEVPLESGSLAGYFFGGSVSIPGTAPGENATFRVRITNQGEIRGESESVQVTLGGGKVPPANLIGLSSVRVQPAIRLTIQASAAGATLSWPKEYSEMKIEGSRELGMDWQVITGVRVTNETSITAPISIATDRQFFRLTD